MLLISVFFALTLLYIPLVNAIQIHETCKTMTGVDEYGYSPDVTHAVSTSYDLMRMIANNAASVANKYLNNKLPPNERARISSLWTAFGIPDGDMRQNIFLIQIEAVWGLLGSKVFLDSSTIFCGTPEGKDQWTYLPKTPLGQNWAWRNYLTDPPFESQDKYQICQDPTHKGPRYSPRTWAFTAEKNVYICAAGFQGLAVTGFPTTLEDRGQDFSKIKGENQLEYWGRSLVAVLMHELHHAAGNSNVDVEIPKEFVPPGFPATGVLTKTYQAYGYAGIAALANWVQKDLQPANTLTHNPDTVAYLAIAIWLFGNDWQDNTAKPVAGGVDSNPADQQASARKLIRAAMAVPHFDHSGIMGTRFLS